MATAITGEFLVNTNTTYAQWAPDIAKIGNGRFLATWNDFTGDPSQITSVRGQIIDESGTKIGNEFIIRSSDVNFVWRPSAVSLAMAMP